MPENRGIDLAKLMAWQDRSEKYARDFLAIVHYAFQVVEWPVNRVTPSTPPSEPQMAITG